MCECQEWLQILTPVRQTEIWPASDGGWGLQDMELMGLDQQLVEVQQGRGEVNQEPAYST